MQSNPQKNYLLQIHLCKLHILCLTSCLFSLFHYNLFNFPITVTYFIPCVCINFVKLSIKRLETTSRNFLWKQQSLSYNKTGTATQPLTRSVQVIRSYSPLRLYMYTLCNIVTFSNFAKIPEFLYLLQLHCSPAFSVY